MTRTALAAALLVSSIGVSHAVGWNTKEEACYFMAGAAGVVAFQRDEGRTQDEIFREAQARIREVVPPGPDQEAALKKDVEFMNLMYGRFLLYDASDAMRVFEEACLVEGWDFLILGPGKNDKKLD